MTIALQGQVLNNKIISTSYNDLAEINLVEMLNQEYNFPVFLQNEANLSALGEYTFSSDIENLASISLHSGIGVGLVKNGKLDVGNKGYAGQLGTYYFVSQWKKMYLWKSWLLRKILLYTSDLSRNFEREKSQ